MADSFVNPIGPGPQVSGGAITTPPQTLAVFTPPTPAPSQPPQVAGDLVTEFAAGDYTWPQF